MTGRLAQRRMLLSDALASCAAPRGDDQRASRADLLRQLFALVQRLESLLASMRYDAARVRIDRHGGLETRALVVAQHNRAAPLRRLLVVVVVVHRSLVAVVVVGADQLGSTELARDAEFAARVARHRKDARRRVLRERFERHAIDARHLRQ